MPDFMAYAIETERKRERRKAYRARVSRAFLFDRYRRRLGRSASVRVWGEHSILVLTGLATLLVGRRHGHLRSAWSADLAGDPEA